MKKLATSDLFAALRIVKAANLREPLKPLLRKVSNGQNSIEDVGIETILIIIEGIAEAKAEDAFYAFLANPFEMKKEDVAALAPAELFSKLKELAEENDLANFFSSLSTLITSR